MRWVSYKDAVLLTCLALASNAQHDAMVPDSHRWHAVGSRIPARTHLQIGTGAPLKTLLKLILTSKATAGWQSSSLHSTAIIGPKRPQTYVACTRCRAHVVAFEEAPTPKEEEDTSERSLSGPKKTLLNQFIGVFKRKQSSPRELYLVRGPPNLGKSSIAMLLAPNASYASTFGSDGAGDSGVTAALGRREQAVAVAGDFIEEEDLDPYLKMGRQHGYRINVITVDLELESDKFNVKWMQKIGKTWSELTGAAALAKAVAEATAAASNAEISRAEAAEARKAEADAFAKAAQAASQVEASDAEASQAKLEAKKAKARAVSAMTTKAKSVAEAVEAAKAAEAKANETIAVAEAARQEAAVASAEAKAAKAQAREATAKAEKSNADLAAARREAATAKATAKAEVEAARAEAAEAREETAAARAQLAQAKAIAEATAAGNVTFKDKNGSVFLFKRNKESGIDMFVNGTMTLEDVQVGLQPEEGLPSEEVTRTLAVTGDDKSQFFGLIPEKRERILSQVDHLDAAKVLSLCNGQAVQVT